MSALDRLTKKHSIPASERTRDRLKELMDGRGEESDVCPRTAHARYRSAVCRRARPIAVEPHNGETDQAATGRTTRRLPAASLRVRGDVPVRGWACRAAASGTSAGGGAGGLGRA